VTKHDETAALIQKTAMLIRDLNQAPARAAGRLADDLNKRVVKLEGILQVAWTYCGSNPGNSAAFDRFVEVLQSYERGCAALAVYERRRTASGHDP